jgi:hypothetical protein
VYARGFRVRRGFLVTLGNVVSSAGDTTSLRRQRLVTDHEYVHVVQARTLGPLYLPLYVGWMVLGGAIGAGVWLARRRRGPLAGARFTKVVETYAYYCNPIEWWAYSRDGRWPPRGMVPGTGWRRPMVRPLTGTAQRPL